MAGADHLLGVRPAHRRAVYIRLPEGMVTGELLCWLRHAEHGWYGYVIWCHERTLHTPNPCQPTS